MPIDVNKVAAALEQHGAGGQCPSCGHNNWGIGEMPLMLTAVDPDSGALMMGQGVQAALVGCNNCGLLRLHGMAALGL